LASCFLGRVLRRLAADWKAVYSQRVVLAESFVDSERFEGVCYAASNWKRVGQTQGRGRNDRFTQRALSVKAIWLHPLCRQWRRILLEEGQA
jgi:hypothetical protein